MQYQICISGSAKGASVKEAHELAERTATHIVKRGHIVLTGATIGLPEYAARAAKKAGGISIGFSPAASRLAHIKKYRLPIAPFDYILYTGFEYTGRNLLMIRSSDAVITIGGRIGTLNEFSIAFEEQKPNGVLTSSGGISDDIRHILKLARRGSENLIFGENPEELVDEVIHALNIKMAKHRVEDLNKGY